MTTFNLMTVLVIEDNATMRTLLRSLMESLGVDQVIECAGADEGYRALRVKKPDLILTDLAMTPIDGIAFTRMVRTAKDSPNPRIPIIMITGHTERTRVEAARDAGVTEFLVKPVTAQNLRARMIEILERPRAFVRSTDYFGPDRRRRSGRDHQGPFRRKGDLEIR